MASRTDPEVPRERQGARRAWVGVNVGIPAHVHRAAKMACAALGLTWHEAAAEAFNAWARERMQQTTRSSPGR